MIALVTPRLVLRPWVPADLVPFAAMCADPEVMRFIGDGSAKTFAEARDSITRSQESWTKHGWGLFAVECLETGSFVGSCGLAEPDLLQPLQPSVEIGWRLERASWGQGYATEAAAAVVDWAFTTLHTKRLVAVVHLDNLASHRVADKIGMRREQRTIVPGLSLWVDVYELGQGSWQPAY
ncbi:MAG: GNAT family N-acetyltransferase [Actinomycetota bacterium]|nr:GNAT family N-acetyltransferase [Actinomycetota bacterium]